MKNDFYRKKAREKEMLGRIREYSDINVGDIVVGGVSGDFYEVTEVLEGKMFKSINLTIGDKKETTSNFQKGRGHYERTIYSTNEELRKAEDF